MSSILELLRELSKITSTPGQGCTRLAYSTEEDEAHDLVWQRLSSTGRFQRTVDAAGNMFVLPEKTRGDGPGPVLIGSHLDTVIDGGWLDGSLGVAAGVHVLETLAKEHPRVSGAGLVVFRDEEGARFGSGLFGSRVFAGLCSEADLSARDSEEISLRDVVPDPSGCVSYERPVTPRAYLECHIEQGLRLEERRICIGVVTGMVGIRRLELVGTGVANHAGTTDMARRVDALVPVASIIGRLPELVEDLSDTVITCGKIRASPGAANIIPGSANAVVEMRAPDKSRIDLVETRLRSLLSGFRPPASATQPAQMSLEPITEVEPVQTDAALLDLLVTVLEERNLPFMKLSSMAGHDAQHAASICPSAMFFIPSIQGVSHSPLEDSKEEDILLAGEVLLQWTKRCMS